MRATWTRFIRGAMLGSLACTSVAGPDAPATTIAAVAVDPPTSSITVGSAVPLQARVQDATGALVAAPTVVWTVRDSTVATVSTSGVVTALAPGTTQIAANVSGRSGIATITVQKVPVASVAVRPSHVELVTGGRATLSAVAYDAAQYALADRAMVWSSSNERVVTVDAAGVLTAVAPGTAVVTATSEGKSEGATVVVGEGPVATVAVMPDSMGMVAGQSAPLAATTRDASGLVVTGRAVVWSSANTAVATVSTAGVVTAVGAGSATITALSEGVAGAARVVVTAPAPPPTVPVPVATVTLSPSSVTIAPTQPTTLSATMRDARGGVLTGRAVAYASSNAAVARVSSAGVVTGVANGSATITATSEGRTGTALVTVQPGSAATVSVTPAIGVLRSGQAGQLVAAAVDAYGNVITGRAFAWQSSDTSLATVSATGVVQAKKKSGLVTITATLDGKSGVAAVSIIP